MVSDEEADEAEQFALGIQKIVMAWLRRDWAALQELLQAAQPGRWENKAVDTILLAKPISVETLCFLAGADEGGYSEATVRRRLKSSSLTPGEILARARAERMAELLRDDQLTVQAIGRAVGFEDKAAAAATFKRFKGMSPRAYRAAQRQASKLPAANAQTLVTSTFVLDPTSCPEARAASCLASTDVVEATHDE